MSDFKTAIRPVSGNHSIKEVVITLFLSNPIMKPERYESLIKNEFRDKFHKFEKVNQVQFQFKGKDFSLKGKIGVALKVNNHKLLRILDSSFSDLRKERW